MEPILNYKKYNIIFIVFLLSFLSACGDDGDTGSHNSIVIQNFIATSDIIDQEIDTVFTVQAYSIKGLPLQYRYKLVDGPGSLSQSSNAVVVYTPDSIGGPLTLRVEVSDSEHNTNTIEKTFHIRKEWQYLRLPATGYDERFQSIAVAGDGTVYTGWQKWRHSVSWYFRVSISKYTGSAWSEVGSYSQRSFNLDMVANDNYVYHTVLNRNSTVDQIGSIQVKYSGASGQEECYTNDFAGYGYINQNRPSLALASDGTLYLACLSGVTKYTTDYLCVFRYQADVTNWVCIGTNISDSSRPRNVSMVIGPDGHPVVAYESINGMTYTKQYNGTSWKPMMYSSVGAGPAMRPKLVLGPDGVMYIIYIDVARGNRLSIKYFDGKNWEYFGEPGFTEGAADWPTLLFDSKGVPYVVFQNETYLGRLSCLQYTGTEWIYAGSPAGTDLGASYIDAAIGPDDTIYAAYRALGGSYGTGVVTLK